MGDFRQRAPALRALLTAAVTAGRHRPSGAPPSGTVRAHPAGIPFREDGPQVWRLAKRGVAQLGAPAVGMVEYGMRDECGPVSEDLAFLIRCRQHPVAVVVVGGASGLVRRGADPAAGVSEREH